MRWMLGAAASAAVVCGTAMATVSLETTIRTAPPAVPVSITQGAADLVCEGGLVAFGRQAEHTQRAEVIAESALTAGTVTSADVRLEALALADGSVPLVLAASADEPTAGAVSIAASSESARGFVASSCSAASMDAWLVGGSTAVGTAATVMLANPADVAAVVTLRSSGVEGWSTPPGFDALAIPARSVAAIPLPSLTATAGQSPSIRVLAQNVGVRASLQTTAIVGLDPAGVDVQAASRAGTHLVIPGVVQPQVRGDLPPEERASVRVVSDESATVDLSIEGGDEPLTERVSVEAGVPVSVDIGDLQPGTYTVHIRADRDVAAAVRTTTGLGRGSDFAWWTAPHPFSSAAAVAVPNGAGPRLHLADVSGRPTEVTVRDRDGDETVLQLDADGTGSVPVTAGSVVLIEPGRSGEIVGAVSFSADGALGQAVVSPDGVRRLAPVVFVD